MTRSNEKYEKIPWEHNKERKLFCVSKASKEEEKKNNFLCAKEAQKKKKINSF
jgi:hypothetical protein